jgi:hypothetical protein
MFSQREKRPPQRDYKSSTGPTSQIASVEPGGLHEGIDEPKRLFHYVNAIINNNQDPFILRYEFLQRVNLISIQNDLARCKGDIWKDGSVSKEQAEILRRLLCNYGRLFSWLASILIIIIITITPKSYPAIIPEFFDGIF